MNSLVVTPLEHDRHCVHWDHSASHLDHIMLTAVVGDVNGD